MKTALSASVLLLAALAFGQPYDHVTITTSAFVSSFAPLGQFVEQNLGLSNTTVTVEYIYANYPGRDNPEKIRNFIRYAYQNWGTTHVLLGGDDDIVPCRFAWARCWWVGIELILPCDLYYSDLNGDWDADGDNVFGEFADSVDLYPDVHVARAPVSFASSVDRFVDKVLTYCADSSADYLRNILLAGFDLDNSTFGETTMGFYDSTLIPSSMRPAAKVYDSHSGNHRQAILDYLNQGQHIFVHADHGNWNVYGAGSTNHGWHITREDMYGLTNGEKFSILVSVGCFTGRFDTLDCIIEYALGAPNGGAVAAMGNSRYGLYGRDAGQNPQRTLSQLQVERVLAMLFSHRGAASLEDFTAAKASLVPLADTSEPDRWCMYAYNLFGEPAMPVWIPSGSAIADPARPADGLVHATWPSHVSRSLALAGRDPLILTDPLGRTVLRLNPGKNDMSSVPSGVYFLRTADRFGRFVGRIVKVSEE